MSGKPTQQAFTVNFPKPNIL